AAAQGGGVLKSLSWLSPIGWAQQVRAYDAERWWVLGLLLAAFIALVGAAAALSVRRDVGAGLVPARLGRSEAAPSLASTWALAWRLQRGALIGWTLGIAVGAAVFGAIAHDINDRVGANSDAARLFAELGGSAALVDSYLAWILGLTGIVATAYAVGAVQRLRSEETELRAEPVLATGVTRWQWAASHLLGAVGGIVVLLLTAGLAVGLVHGLRSRDVPHALP